MPVLPTEYPADCNAVCNFLTASVSSAGYGGPAANSCATTAVAVAVGVLR